MPPFWESVRGKGAEDVERERQRERQRERDRERETERETERDRERREGKERWERAGREGSKADVVGVIEE